MKTNMRVVDLLRKGKEIVTASYPIGQMCGVPYRPVIQIEDKEPYKCVLIELSEERLEEKLSNTYSEIKEEGFKVIPCKLQKENGRTFLPLILTGWQMEDRELAAYNINAVKDLTQKVIGGEVELYREKQKAKTGASSYFIGHGPHSQIIYSFDDYKIRLETSSVYLKDDEKDSDAREMPLKFLHAIPKYIEKFNQANERNGIQRFVRENELNLVHRNGNILLVEYSIPLKTNKVKLEKGILSKSEWEQLCKFFSEQGYMTNEGVMAGVSYNPKRIIDGRKLIPLQELPKRPSCEEATRYGLFYLDIETAKRGLEAIISQGQWWTILDAIYLGGEIKAKNPKPKLVIYHLPSLF